MAATKQTGFGTAGFGVGVTNKSAGTGIFRSTASITPGEGFYDCEHVLCCGEPSPCGSRVGCPFSSQKFLNECVVFSIEYSKFSCD